MGLWARGCVQSKVLVNYTAAAVWAVASLGLPLACESSSSQSPQDPPWSKQLHTPFPTWEFQRSLSSRGGVAMVEEGALNRPACLTPGHGGASSSHGGGRGSLPCWAPLGRWGLWPQVRLRNNLPPGVAGQGCQALLGPMIPTVPPNHLARYCGTFIPDS